MRAKLKEKFESYKVVPLGGTKSSLQNEIWQDGFRSTLDYAIFKTLANGITLKGELSAGIAKSLVRNRVFFIKLINNTDK